jgi:hypothetical protein
MGMMPQYNSVKDVVDTLTELFDLGVEEQMILHTAIYQLYSAANGYTLEDLLIRFNRMFARVQLTAINTLSIPVHQNMN